MISKTQIQKIIFIQKHIVKKDVFTFELYKYFGLLSNNKINGKQFNEWLNSWEATAELDRDPAASKRIKDALKEIRLKKTSHKSWREFRNSIGLS